MLTVLSLTLAATGCIPTICPIYTGDDVVFKQELIGEWWQPRGEYPWTFAKRDDTSYTLTMADKGGEGEFIAHLVVIGDQLFLDLSPDPKKQPQQVSVMWRMLWIEAHTFFHVRQIEPVLELAALDRDWLDRFLNEHPSDLAHSRHPRDKQMIILTGETKELQKFLLAHKDAFTQYSKMEKRRAQPTPAGDVLKAAPEE